MKKLFKNILAPVLRGAIKTIPGGGIAVELVKNISHSVKENKEEEKPPHNWISILTQLAGVGVIIYAFVKKLITIEQVLSFLGLQ